MSRNTPDPDEARTVLLAQSGDREALEALLRAVQPPLYRYLLRLSEEAGTAEDLLQESLPQICRAIGSLREPELFRPWAYRVATRICHRRLKSLRRSRVEPLEEITQRIDSVQAGESDVQGRVELSMDLRDAIPTLAPGPRGVLLLHYFDGFPLADVAAILEIPLGTVKSRMSQGLSELRRHLAR